MKHLFLLFTLVFISSFAFAQHPGEDFHRCATTEYMEAQMKLDPGLRERLERMENQLEQAIAENKGLPKNGKDVMTIPVVVHVVYKTAAQNISDAQILSQIAVLNRDYRRLNTDTNLTPQMFKSVAADCQIEFCMAQRDPQGNPTTGITRTLTTLSSFGIDNKVKYTAQGGCDAWDKNKYLNLWVCNLGSNLLGYAQFPGGNPATDGVVILYSAFGTSGAAAYPFNKGRTATHEIGHWINLYHIWGDDNGACTGSDYVNDTPNQASENYYCPSFPHSTCGNTSDMFMNYMDYTDDACMNLFTQGQKTRMVTAINMYRSSLLNSNACLPLLLADFLSSDTALCQGDSISFTANTPVAIYWKWEFPGGTPDTSLLQNPVITYNTPGIYDVSLIVSDGSDFDTIFRPAFIHVKDKPALNLGNDTTLCVTNVITFDAGNPGASYLWSTGDTVPSVTIDTVGVGAATKKVWVDVTNPNGCMASDTVNVTFAPCFGITQHAPEPVSIYPNPSHGEVYVEFGKVSPKNLTIKVFNVIGKLVSSQVLENPGQKRAVLDISGQPRGIYIISVKADNQVVNKKFSLVK